MEVKRGKQKVGKVLCRHRAMDIATYRMNWPRGQFSDKPKQTETDGSRQKQKWTEADRQGQKLMKQTKLDGNGQQHT